MRIISGYLKGRKFSPPMDKWPTRPTTDFAKESLYNILVNKIDFKGIRVLDLFGGAGSHTFEAISRGAEHVTFVDKYPPAIQFVRKTAGELKIEENITTLKVDVNGFLKKGATLPYDLIIADPPYQMPGIDSLPELIKNGKFLVPGGIFVLEHGNNNDFSKNAALIDSRKYGGSFFSFFSF